MKYKNLHQNKKKTNEINSNKMKESHISVFEMLRMMMMIEKMITHVISL